MVVVVLKKNLLHSAAEDFLHDFGRREGIEVSGEGVDVDAWGERPAYDRLTRVATYRSPPPARCEPG